jgi:hypothetical protein
MNTLRLTVVDCYTLRLTAVDCWGLGSPATCTGSGSCCRHLGPVLGSLALISLATRGRLMLMSNVYYSQPPASHSTAMGGAHAAIYRPRGGFAKQKLLKKLKYQAKLPCKEPSRQWVIGTQKECSDYGCAFTRLRLGAKLSYTKSPAPRSGVYLSVACCTRWPMRSSEPIR